jgi:hypothetical protein
VSSSDSRFFVQVPNVNLDEAGMAYEYRENDRSTLKNSVLACALLEHQAFA